jgi:hypothetical protein
MQNGNVADMRKESGFTGMMIKKLHAPFMVPRKVLCKKAVPKNDPDGKEEQPLEVSGPSKGIPEDGWVVSAMLEKRMGNKSSQTLGAKRLIGPY